jgi:hypothetical protein
MWTLERVMREDYGRQPDVQLALSQTMLASGNSDPTAEQIAAVLRKLAQDEIAGASRVQIDVKSSSSNETNGI